MKISLLPEIDLARAAVLGPDARRNVLEQVRVVRPILRYDPYRRACVDLFNIQFPMIKRLPPTFWEAIEGSLRAASRSKIELDANIAVSRATYDYVVKNSVFGWAHSFFPLNLGGRRLAYWLPMALVIDGRLTVPFVDPRRGRGLTKEARRFVFSVMHERIRAAEPDFNEVQFVIMQFNQQEDGSRTLVPHFDKGVKRFSFEQLEQMVSDTEKAWLDVCVERSHSARRGAGKPGSLI